MRSFPTHPGPLPREEGELKSVSRQIDALTRKVTAPFSLSAGERAGVRGNEATKLKQVKFTAERPAVRLHNPCNLGLFLTVLRKNKL